MRAYLSSLSLHLATIRLKSDRLLDRLNLQRGHSHLLETGLTCD